MCVYTWINSKFYIYTSETKKKSKKKKKAPLHRAESNKPHASIISENENTKKNKKPKSESQRCLLTQAFLNLWRSLSSLFPSPTRKLKALVVVDRVTETTNSNYTNYRKFTKRNRNYQTFANYSTWRSPSPVTASVYAYRRLIRPRVTPSLFSLFLSNQLPRRLILIYFIC